jgi:nucleoside-diphosphate-sugar epimerase
MGEVLSRKCTDIMKVLATGASGFVGKPLIAKLLLQGYSVCAAVRSESTSISSAEVVLVGEINGETSWTDALRDIDVVIHLAARVHVMAERSANPLVEFRNVNVEGTRHLAELAAKTGVKRFVYVSSVKVNGEQTTRPFSELNEPYPLDPYGVSKFEAEQALRKISAETKMEFVIVRPPLVYGAGVKGNFAHMIKVLEMGMPLPFASVQNLRSFIYVENLVDALSLCSTHPNAAGQTYLVSDGEDISTPDLLSKLSGAMGRSASLLPCPLALMRLAGQLLGKSDQIDRLVGSLQVDSSKIRRELGWKPPFSIDEGLSATVKVTRKEV